MKYLGLIAIVLALSIIAATAQTTRSALSIDQVYTEIVSPLQQEIWTLKLEILKLRNDNDQLTKRIAELEREKEKVLPPK